MAPQFDIEDGSKLEYGPGRFDDWCVYHVSRDGRRTPPRDSGYFDALKRLASVHGPERLYSDFCEIYDCVTSEFDLPVCKLILERSRTFGLNSTEYQVTMGTLYMAMVAEENKQGTRLGKRIKRLGVHQVLVEDLLPNLAANHSRGMPWREIDRECRVRGF